MTFGTDNLSKGSKGDAVVELQLRLAGFKGTVWDGDFGPKTELQVKAFQQDYMGIAEPDGIAGERTYAALDIFSQAHAPDFGRLVCTCNGCWGFGNGQFKGKYTGNDKKERYHKYEYPGIHKAIIHSYTALRFYSLTHDIGCLFETCGYRCWVRNSQKNRTSTNHMGKAIDCDYLMEDGDDKRDDIGRCNKARDLLVKESNFQVGWRDKNQKSLEPEIIAPSWIHMDVRSYEEKYLNDRFFVKNIVELLNKEL